MITKSFKKRFLKFMQIFFIQSRSFLPTALLFIINKQSEMLPKSLNLCSLLFFVIPFLVNQACHWFISKNLIRKRKPLFECQVSTVNIRILAALLHLNYFIWGCLLAKNGNTFLYFTFSEQLNKHILYT